MGWPRDSFLGYWKFLVGDWILSSLVAFWKFLPSPFVMSAKGKHPPQAATLRERAEKLFRETLDSSLDHLDGLSPETLRTSLHELRVHQIELEMQNEEMLRSQTELAKSRALYFDLYDLAPVGYCTVSEKGLILRANLSAVTLLGMDRSRLLERTFSSFLIKEDQDSFYLLRKRLLDTGKPQAGELRILRPDGVTLWVRVDATTTPADDGSPLCQVILSDITGRKQAEDAVKAEQLLTDAIIESIPGAFFLLDENGRFSRWNAYEREEIIGKPDAVIAGMSAIETIHPDDRAFVESKLKSVLKSGGAETLETRVLLRGGPEFRWFLLTGRRMEIAGRLFLIGTGIDTTEIRRAEEALRESMQRYALTLEAASDGLWDWKIPDGSAFFSPHYYSLLGYGDGEFPANYAAWRTMVHPEDIARAEEDLRLAVQDGKGFIIDLRMKMKSGEWRWFSTHGRVGERDAEGHAVRMVGTLYDITERRETEEERKNLLTAVEQSANTIVITDPCGNIEYVNPAFEKSTGYSAAEARGKNPRVLKSGTHDEAFYKDLWSTISSGKIWRGQIHNRRKDGSLYWESATISPVFDSLGKIAAHIAVKEDITDRKAMEDSRLEAMERTEAANRAKSEFLAIMSHELRTPLNGVLGFAELLAETPLNKEQMDFARIIAQSGNHLLQVVNDILDFSSIEKGRMLLESAPIAIASLLESAFVTIRKTAADKGLELLFTVDPALPEQITGDLRRIRQILINLIGNAVKFTSRGSVVVRVTPSSLADRPALDFSVEDTGPGIHPEAVGLLFQPFVQEDMTLHRPFEGTGLGLAISQRLAEAMGGTITVHSVHGQGCTFALRLPLEATVGTGLPPAAAPCSTQPGRRPASPDPNLVLVVEDDPSNSDLAGKMLGVLGCSVEFAFDGQRAVDAYAPGKFSAILMDMQMPVMDGLTATQKIRELESSSEHRVPIIAVTANVMPGDRERCLAAGMDAFLSKPYSKTELAAKLAGFARAF